MVEIFIFVPGLFLHKMHSETHPIFKDSNSWFSLECFWILASRLKARNAPTDLNLTRPPILDKSSDLGYMLSATWLDPYSAGKKQRQPFMTLNVWGPLTSVLPGHAVPTHKYDDLSLVPSVTECILRFITLISWAAC